MTSWVSGAMTEAASGLLWKLEERGGPSPRMAGFTEKVNKQEGRTWGRCQGRKIAAQGAGGRTTQALPSSRTLAEACEAVRLRKIGLELRQASKARVGKEAVWSQHISLQAQLHYLGAQVWARLTLLSVSSSVGRGSYHGPAL